jgi:hypothetical protein
MSTTARALAALALLCGLGLAARADDEAEVIIDKALKAHFPKGLDKKDQGLRTKGKGTLHIMGLDLDITQEASVQLPNKFKEVVDLTVMGKNVTIVTVYNGKDVWIRADGKDVPVNADIKAEIEDAVYGMGLMQGVFLKDRSVKFSLVGEVKVKDRPAVGVTVSRQGKKDINLFFDKETGLLAKAEMRRRDLMSGEEVTEERFVTAYQESGGRKVAKKVEILRDGKPYLEMEVTEVQVLEKLDDSEFAQPK